MRNGIIVIAFGVALGALLSEFVVRPLVASLKKAPAAA